MVPALLSSWPGRNEARVSITARSKRCRSCSSAMRSSKVCHCPMVGLLEKGRHNQQISSPNANRRRRRLQSSFGSSETTSALPAVTGRPRSAPPVFSRASRAASSVVLPHFGWLVNKVRLPGASRPRHSQVISDGSAVSKSWVHDTGSSESLTAAEGIGSLAGRFGTGRPSVEGLEESMVERRDGCKVSPVSFHISFQDSFHHSFQDRGAG